MNAVFPHAIGRLSYAIRFLVCMVAAAFISELARQRSINEVAANIAWLVTALYVLLFVYAPRMRHAGMEKLWLILIPIANALLVLALFFVPEDGFDSWEG